MRGLPPLTRIHTAQNGLTVGRVQSQISPTFRHSAYGAFRLGYAVTVARDAVCALAGVDEDEALEHLRTAYGSHVAGVAELTGVRVAAAVAPLGAGYETGEVLEHEP